MTDILLNTFIVLFVVIDPVGLAALFAGMTLGAEAGYARRMALRGVVVAAVVLVVFAVLGDALLHYLGIGLDAFRIAGGILLFMVAIDMLYARHSGLRSPTEVERRETGTREDISVFPLAIPLIAGPGAMTSVLLLSTEHREDAVMLGILAAILFAVLVITLALLLLASRLMRVLGHTGANVISRVLGVVLAALAVQVILDGLTGAWPGG